MFLYTGVLRSLIFALFIRMCIAHVYKAHGREGGR